MNTSEEMWKGSHAEKYKLPARGRFLHLSSFQHGLLMIKWPKSIFIKNDFPIQRITIM